MKFRKFSTSYVRQGAQNARYLFRLHSGYKLGLFRHFRTCNFWRKGAVYSRLSIFSGMPEKMGLKNRHAVRALTWTRREHAHHMGVTRRLHPMSGIVPMGEKRRYARYVHVVGHPDETAVFRAFPRFFVTATFRAGMRQDFFFQQKSRTRRHHHTSAEKRISHAFKPRYSV